MGVAQAQQDAHGLVERALQHISAGRYADGIAAYRGALRASDPVPWLRLEILIGLGGALARIGDFAEAEQQFRAAYEDALRTTSDPSPTVSITRYFLAEHLIHRTNRPAEALDVIAPALSCPSASEGLLQLLKAEALWMLSRRDEARSAANVALKLAATDDQRYRMQGRLSALPGWTGD